MGRGSLWQPWNTKFVHWNIKCLILRHSGIKGTVKRKPQEMALGCDRYIQWPWVKSFSGNSLCRRKSSIWEIKALGKSQSFWVQRERLPILQTRKWRPVVAPSVSQPLAAGAGASAVLWVPRVSPLHSRLLSSPIVKCTKMAFPQN